MTREVRASIAVLLWFGTLGLLAVQLIAIGWILNVVVGLAGAITACLILLAVRRPSPVVP